MSTIFITMDMHGDFKRLSRKSLLKANLTLTEDDYLLVGGDFGLLWCYDKEYEYNIKWLGNLPFTILWIQGNHENYNMIKDFNIEYWNGGKVRHIVRDKIILLERGQVFNINGKTFFTFGGAESNDIEGGILDRNDANFKAKKKILNKRKVNYRILNESWWKEELPSEEEIQEGITNLEKVNYKVDYIITHCASVSMQNKLCVGSHKNKVNILTEFLDKIEKEVDYKYWYFGHYHLDREISENQICLYRDIVEIKE